MTVLSGKEGGERRQSVKAEEYRARMGRRPEREEGEARRIRPEYEITLHPCGLRKKFKTAISIKFNLAQVSNQTQRRNETGGSLPCKSPTGPRGPQLRLPTIILKGRPFSEIYGFTWNFRLKFSRVPPAGVIPISVNSPSARFHFRSTKYHPVDSSVIYSSRLVTSR